MESKITCFEDKRICYPRYDRGEFSNLSEAYQYDAESTHPCFHVYLDKIVQYNIRYRDYLRTHGIEKLIELLIFEAPKLKEDRKPLDDLREWYERIGKIADYDIQCYNINSTFEVLGHKVEGLKMVNEYTELTAWERYNEVDVWLKRNSKSHPDGLHFGKMYMNYPMFDSCDSCDDREYQNYLIRNNPIQKSDFENLFNVKSDGNACRVHENMPADILPVLYYVGTGNYMLLATNK